MYIGEAYRYANDCDVFLIYYIAPSSARFLIFFGFNFF